MAIQHSFTGRNVLVTGANQGIGYALAQAFAEADAHLFILSENEAINAAAAKLRAATGAHVEAIICDISDFEAVAAAIAPLPRIDVLVNNAGYQPMTPIRDTSAKARHEFDRVIDINVKGTYYVTREILPHMQSGGRIILTSSIWGKSGAALYSGYCASKHATIGFMRALAHELGSDGITVNAVCPGWVETEGSMWTLEDESQRSGRPLQDLVDEFLVGQPIGGMMQPAAMAPMYLFLASDAACDITGQAFNVDRGSFIG